MLTRCSWAMLFLICLSKPVSVTAQEVNDQDMVSSIASPTITAFTTSSPILLGRRDTTNRTNIWGWDSSVDSRRVLFSSDEPEITYNTLSSLSDLGQALQCPSTAVIATVTLTDSPIISILTYVGCPATSGTPANIDPTGGICHSSGFVTFSVNGSGNVCCPNGWGTRTVTSDVFCTTKIDLGVQPATSTVSPGPSITQVLGLSGVVFTRAGMVQNEAARTVAVTGGSGAVATSTGSSRNSGGRPGVETWQIQTMIALMAGALFRMSPW